MTIDKQDWIDIYSGAKDEALKAFLVGSKSHTDLAFYMGLCVVNIKYGLPACLTPKMN